MGVEAWSTTAADNDASPPDGAPEGMAAGTVNNTIRQVMASVRALAEDAAWFDWGHTPTRINGTSFSVPDDLTAIYHVGRRLKVTGSATGYASIASSSYSAPNTTATVTMDSGSLPVTLSAVYVSILPATNSAIPSQTNISWTIATGGSLSLSTALPVASGGTGATSVAGARSALGVSAAGSDTTYSFRANNLSDLASAAASRTNLGVPSTTGTGASGTWGINISGSAASASISSIASSALTVDPNGTINGNLVGYRRVPRRTLGIGDNECLATSSGVTINTSDLATGGCFCIYNDSGSAITITQGAGVTLRLGGTTSTGSRTLAARGLATIWCNSASEAIALGAGVS